MSYEKELKLTQDLDEIKKIKELDNSFNYFNETGRMSNELGMMMAGVRSFLVKEIKKDDADTDKKKLTFLMAEMFTTAQKIQELNCTTNKNKIAILHKIADIFTTNITK